MFFPIIYGILSLMLNNMSLRVRHTSWRTWVLKPDTRSSYRTLAGARRSSQFFIILISFILNSCGPIPTAQADEFFLPAPGVMVHLSPEFTPALLKGIVIHPENAFKFDFIIYKGDKKFTESQKKEEYTKLIKYFLASLATPDEDQWVNLSPYEKDRIIKDDFGKTAMGRDLLAQDYLLKQITASLIYPQDKLGRKFWDEIYEQAYKQYGTTNIPVNTFNKVWIVPDEADIYEKGNIAYLYKSHLKVMLEEDYLSLEKYSGIKRTTNDAHTIASQVVRAIVLPQLEKEVNENKNFAPLRQVFSGMILAAWYKRALRESLLAKIYANKSKVKGVDQDPKNNEAIYQQYLKAYKKGVFNFIKEDADKYTNQTIPRKYFSGGTSLLGSNGMLALTRHKGDQSAAMAVAGSLGQGAGMDLAEISIDPAFKGIHLVLPPGKINAHARPPYQPITEEEMRQVLGPYELTLARMVGRLQRLRVTKSQVGRVVVDYYKDGPASDSEEAFWRIGKLIADSGKYKIPLGIRDAIRDLILVIFYDQNGAIRDDEEILRDSQAVYAALPDAAMTQGALAQTPPKGMTDEEMRLVEWPRNLTLEEAIGNLRERRVTTSRIRKYIEQYERGGSVKKGREDKDRIHKFYIDLFSDRWVLPKVKKPIFEAILTIFYDQQGNGRDNMQISRNIQAVYNGLSGVTIPPEEYVEMLDYYNDHQREIDPFKEHNPDHRAAAIALHAAFYDLSKEDQHELILEGRGPVAVPPPSFSWDKNTSVPVPVPRQRRGVSSGGQPLDEAMTTAAIPVATFLLAAIGILYKWISKPSADRYFYDIMINELKFYWAADKRLRLGEDFERYVEVIENWFKSAKYRRVSLLYAFGRILTDGQIRWLRQREGSLEIAKPVLDHIEKFPEKNSPMVEMVGKALVAGTYLYLMMLNKVSYLNFMKRFLDQEDFEKDIDLINIWYWDLEKSQQTKLVELFSKMITEEQANSLRNWPQTIFIRRLLQERNKITRSDRNAAMKAGILPIMLSAVLAASSTYAQSPKQAPLAGQSTVPQAIQQPVPSREEIEKQVEQVQLIPNSKIDIRYEYDNVLAIRDTEGNVFRTTPRNLKIVIPPHAEFDGVFVFYLSLEGPLECQSVVKNDGKSRKVSVERVITDPSGRIVGAKIMLDGKLLFYSLLSDKASVADLGGIDMNAAHLNMNIKRDVHGVPLPVGQQDLGLIHIDGLVPVILDIRPVASSAIWSQLMPASTAGTSA